MTAKEAVDRLEQHKEWGFVEETVQAIDMGIAALEKQASGGWIPVEEKPDKIKKVLVQNDFSEVTTGYYNGTLWVTPYKWDECVVAWQPLPEGYRPEG